MESIMNLINSCVFPIAMCVMMAWYIKDTNGRHTEEMNKIIEAVNNNTVAIEKLSERIER